MDRFPNFMTTPENAVASEFQSPGVRGWVYDGTDGKQMAYWVCERDGRSSEHVHAFDEYFIVIQGRYTLMVDDRRIDLGPGQEWFIPGNQPHAGEFIAGTRTIHCFGGTRAKRGSKDF